MIWRFWFWLSGRQATLPAVEIATVRSLSVCRTVDALGPGRTSIGVSAQARTVRSVGPSRRVDSLTQARTLKGIP